MSDKPDDDDETPKSKQVQEVHPEEIGFSFVEKSEDANLTPDRLGRRDNLTSPPASRPGENNREEASLTPQTPKSPKDYSTDKSLSEIIAASIDQAGLGDSKKVKAALKASGIKIIEAEKKVEGEKTTFTAKDNSNRSITLTEARVSNGVFENIRHVDIKVEGGPAVGNLALSDEKGNPIKGKLMMFAFAEDGTAMDIEPKRGVKFDQEIAYTEIEGEKVVLPISATKYKEYLAQVEARTKEREAALASEASQGSAQRPDLRIQIPGGSQRDNDERSPRAGEGTPGAQGFAPTWTGGAEQPIEPAGAHPHVWVPGVAPGRGGADAGEQAPQAMPAPPEGGGVPAAPASPSSSSRSVAPPPPSQSAGEMFGGGHGAPDGASTDNTPSQPAAAPPPPPPPAAAPVVNVNVTVNQPAAGGTEPAAAPPPPPPPAQPAAGAAHSSRVNDMVSGVRATHPPQPAPPSGSVSPEGGAVSPGVRPKRGRSGSGEGGAQSKS